MQSTGQGGPPRVEHGRFSFPWHEVGPAVRFGTLSQFSELLTLSCPAGHGIWGPEQTIEGHEKTGDRVPVSCFFDF